MQYFVGVDIGTTSVKSVAYNANGEMLHLHAVEYAMDHPAPGYAEQDAVFIFDAVISCLKKTIDALSVKPAFVAFSAAMHSIMAVKENGAILSPLIIWADNRAASVAERMHKAEQAKFYYDKTGVPVHAMSPLCKLVWLKENEAGIFNEADKLIGIKEYVWFRLFNQFVIDSSVASATGLLNIFRLQWDDDILASIGLPHAKLSQVVAPQFVQVYRHSEILFLQNIPFVIGASDGALANLGSASAGEKMAVTIGTSGAVRVMLHRPMLDENMRSFCYHVYNENYVIGGANNNGAVVLQWLKENILQSNDDMNALLAKAQDVSIGAEGIITLPYILAERAPIWNAHAKAVWFGMQKKHGQKHLIRAAMESVMYSLLDIAESIMQKHQVRSISASGGFTKNKAWVQMLADVFNVPVQVASVPEASAFGAVILGAAALQLPLSFEEQTSCTFLPSAAAHEKYMQVFARYRRLYALLKTEMQED